MCRSTCETTMGIRTDSVQDVEVALRADVVARCEATFHISIELWCSSEAAKRPDTENKSGDSLANPTFLPILVACEYGLLGDLD